VSSTTSTEADAFRQFMAVVPASQAAPPAATPSGPGPRGRGAKAGAPGVPAGLIAAVAEGRVQVRALSRARLPVYFPHLIAAGSSFEAPVSGSYPRAYSIGRYAAYRIVLAADSALGQYYGVQGTAWQHAPIMNPPLEARIVGGRKLELHYDGRKLRLVAWRTPHGVYWVSNTLSLTLSNPQMLGIAASLARR
jgi:hypothetical protein